MLMLTEGQHKLIFLVIEAFKDKMLIFRCQTVVLKSFLCVCSYILGKVSDCRAHDLQCFVKSLSLQYS